MKALSLFANIGVSEAYLKDIGVEVVVANELVKRRADLYSKIYPDTDMIIGDINEKETFDEIIKKSNECKVDVVIATPPCQGMSTVGQQKKNDERNKLILPVIRAVKLIQPRYVFIENVPNFLNTSIEVEGKSVLIPDLIERELASDYYIKAEIIDTKDYSVPQTRERVIFLLTRKEEEIIWNFPEKETKIITMEDAIGDLPIIDPFVYDVSKKELLELFPRYYEREKAALSISKWNRPPRHVKRQVIAMRYTPTGRTAFDNKHYFPKKENGEPVRGYKNTYKRQNWDKPAYTVTMDNRKISSQNNVHPGRYLGKDENGYDIYSDPRALTVYELMIISSLPEDWPVPSDTSEALLRSAIGEGIPPLFVKKTFEQIMR